MKLALIALVSCMALSVKSHTYAEFVSIPEGAVTTKAFLPSYARPHIPVVDVQSTDIICRSPDMTFKAEPFAIEAGQEIRITWSTSKPTSPYAGIDPVGPCAFWLSPLEKKGVGKVWSKIYEYTNDGEEKATNWCSAKIVNSNNFLDFPIPEDIIPGKYLLRTEIIDILGGEKTNYADFTMGPHFYSNCLVLDITGNGTAPLKNPVSILDVYKPYYKKPFYTEGTKNKDFTLPGPAPYTKGKA
ncbi:hypothetical protein GGI03_003156 [Coemansia sp. RSA 2337]|nr:hypothetical protein GGH13_004926 [Coemansia sp. S155-1]KAJ2101133.1 hypothetical protein IW146_009398 [Coemansia sp. RSA 922]KAJ2347923.1 hypothetical protein GGH92_003012 [Coemansia sp. RSA 2673]KAJ2464553.1 hypothetical protein GGI03_003156 [Coemansia sp. RSA 2337]